MVKCALIILIYIYFLSSEVSNRNIFPIFEFRVCSFPSYPGLYRLLLEYLIKKESSFMLIMNEVPQNVIL